MGDTKKADNPQGEDKDKRVKIQVEGEYEVGEGETGRKKMKRFQLPNLPRWWQAKIIQYAFTYEPPNGRWSPSPIDINAPSTLETEMARPMRL